MWDNLERNCEKNAYLYHWSGKKLLSISHSSENGLFGISLQILWGKIWHFHRFLN